MVPLATLATITPSGGPDVVYRYNRFRAIQLLGSPAPGYSSGQASAAMEEVAAASLPQGFGYEWTGTTYQEKQAQGNEGAIFGFAAVLVFLFLAALYESWSIPFAVLLAIPLGMFGALAAVFLRAYPYDIYTQIGIVTLIGLAAKNAILIVEFAKESHAHGKSVREAAIEAAHLRLRPILMTSFAFIFGVLPLVLASGASSAARRSLGTTVFGGMLTATLLAIFIVPVLYVIIESFVERRRTAGASAPVAEAAQ
jgi:multidrug efflux pump